MKKKADRKNSRKSHTDSRGIRSSPECYGDPMTARLVIVAEAAHTEEKLANCPLVGHSGRALLLLLLGATGRPLTAGIFTDGQRIWDYFLPGQIALLNLWKDTSRTRPTEWGAGKTKLPEKAPVLVLGEKAEKRFNTLYPGRENVMRWFHPSPRHRKFFSANRNGTSLESCLSFVKHALANN